MTYQHGIQYPALLAAAALGLLRVPTPRLVACLVVFGTFVNLISESRGDGSGLCTGFVGWPVALVVVAALSRNVGRLVWMGLVWMGFIHEPPPPVWDGLPRCEACGYLLVGLPGRTCPECGRPFSSLATEGEDGLSRR